jgi:hypothetical protein
MATLTLRFLPKSHDQGWRTSEENGVSLIDLELVHLGLGHLHNAVVVGLGLLDQKTIGGLL